MDVKEASGVCKNRVKWRARIKGGDIMLLASPIRDYSVMIMYVIDCIFMHNSNYSKSNYCELSFLKVQYFIKSI
jgi:hypothetical protein